MVFYAGFPIEGPTISSLTIFMPYLDQHDGKVKYTQINTFHSKWSSVTFSDGAEKIAHFCWLNKLNPDWLQIKQPNPQVELAVTGEVFLQSDKPVMARINITAGTDKVDRWWGSNQIAKYGVCGFLDGAGNVIMPLKFINTIATTFIDVTQFTTGMYVNLQPGVVATIKFFTNTVPQQDHQLVPPVGWSSPTAFNIVPFGFYALPLDIPATATYVEQIP